MSQLDTQNESVKNINSFNQLRNQFVGNADVIAAVPVGSRTIEGAKKPSSDYDLLVLSKRPIPHYLESLGYQLDFKSKHYEPANSQFNSWRRGNANVILTASKFFAQDFMRANQICVDYLITERAARVSIFQAILYGNPVNPLGLKDTPHAWAGGASQ